VLAAGAITTSPTAGHVIHDEAKPFDLLLFWRPPDPQQVWRPNVKFAGVCTHAYKKGTVERIVKASAVRRFLEEELGPAGS
jgi:hypothetical protein